RMYEITGEASYLRKVVGAHEDIAGRQLYITGGVSAGEHYKGDRFKPITGPVVETCANMSWLELNQALLELTGQPKYADLIETLLWNHAFAAQAVDGDGYCYHTPPNGEKPHGYFGDPCCCTSSGHRMVSKLPSVIYAVGDGRLYVNQFVPSRAEARIGESLVRISQETNYPEDERVTIRLEADRPVGFALCVRLPAWCATPAATLNGQALTDLKPGTYLVLEGPWKTADRLELTFPMTLRWQPSDGGERQPPATGADRRWALVRGPVVYAADTVLADELDAALDPGVDVGVVPSDAPAYARVDLPPGAMGPGFSVPVVTADGRRTTMPFWPFANVGHWYRPGRPKPARDAAAYRYAAWLTARDSREFIDRRVKAVTPGDAAGPLECRLHPETQTVSFLALGPSGPDLTPDAPELDTLEPGFHQLGDVTLRYRQGNEPWRRFATADRTRPAKILSPSEAGVEHEADLSDTGAEPMPLQLRRQWRRRDGILAMRFELRNTSQRPVEIGAFGASMVFNNFFNEPIHGDHRLIHERRFYAQPYVGGEAGYLQVTRVDGRGGVLLVLPGPHTPFEACRHLSEHPFRRNVDFEGFYEWTVHSRAWVEEGWPARRQWNAATARVLAPGEGAAYEFQFVVAPSVSEVEATLAAHGRPVVVGIPGYLLPLGETGRLFVKAPAAIEAVTVEPAGVLEVLSPPERAAAWQGYAVLARRPGRCRVAIAYADGRRQFVHYNVIPSQGDQVARLAAFHDERQWFADPDDPYGRTHAYMPYDRQAQRRILDEPRVFISGLSDEPGAGANLLMAMKNLYSPTAGGVARLEQYVDGPLWGRLQNREDYSLRASLFHGPPGCWDEARSKETWRAYNYPHQTAIYWALYRLARNHQGLVARHPWDWYLHQAFGTAMAMKRFCGPGSGDGNVSQLEQWGLMVASVFLDLLADLGREGWTDEADELEGYMRYRAEIWNARPYPFGSEMPWGPTSQEEIYLWCEHFGFADKARLTLDTILAGAPGAPNWGYNGSMHFYFAAFVYGKWPRLERELHWYLSSLCAIPLLDAFRNDPNDLRLLRIGYAGATGVLGNIDADGHGSMSFHATPDVMEFDPYTSDYGCHFYGYCRNAGAYLVKDEEFGWLGFGADVTTDGATVRVRPRDAFGRRVFLAPLGLWLTLESGRFENVTMDLSAGEVTVALAAAQPHTPSARLIVEQPAKGPGPAAYRPAAPLPLVRGAWEVTLGPQPVSVTLRRQPDGR
ncbi:MAG: DUF5695 domain-containing protein, partial [Planctomycetota bacterium]|nr:DUF5695 domain-containing protein [Planctomycetota bacterium]